MNTSITKYTCRTSHMRDSLLWLWPSTNSFFKGKMGAEVHGTREDQGSYSEVGWIERSKNVAEKVENGNKKSQEKTKKGEKKTKNKKSNKDKEKQKGLEENHTKS